MTLTPVNSGWIEVICGPMFSGKTEELIRRLVRAKIAKQDVRIFKPAIDNRYSEEDIVSHNGRIIKSIALSHPEEILEHLDEADVIGIDEAHFFSFSLVNIVKKLADDERRVVVAGLDKDYLARPFETVSALMVEAEYVTKLLAICVQCGDPANYSQRLSMEEDRVVVGEADKYEARCRKCFDPDGSKVTNMS